MENRKRYEKIKKKFSDEADGSRNETLQSIVTKIESKEKERIEKITIKEWDDKVKEIEDCQ
jgi:hypothetical protein